MDKIELKQGEDKIITIPMYKEDGGALDLSAATEIIAGLFVNGTLMSKFSLSTKDNYGAILVQGTNNNEIKILVRRAITKQYNVGVLKASILVQAPDAVLDKKRTEYEFDLGSVVKGNLLGEELPMLIPAAPTNPIVDDSANTFDWTVVVGFNDAESYEISVDGGSNWNNVEEKPYNVGNVAIAAGDVQVRVQKNDARDIDSGLILVSTDPFTQI